MSPFYFGTQRRRLFGIYEPAVSGAGQRAAVLCHPCGAEYVHAHRSMRQLAAKLSEAGFHTLRFDYFGTGDSAGETTDISLDGWENDVEMAMEELKDMVGAAQVALVGLRAGAALASQVAARRAKEVNAIILWDPIISGQEFFRSLQPRHRKNGYSGVINATGSDRLHQDWPTNLYGSPLPAIMVRELQNFDLRASIQALPLHTRIIKSDRMASHDALRSIAANSAAGAIEIEDIADVLPWMEDNVSGGAMPAKVIKSIVEYLKCTAA